ncbi:unnamed protein product [Closterium sp. NIES-54]
MELVLGGRRSRYWHWRSYVDGGVNSKGAGVGGTDTGGAGSRGARVGGACFGGVGARGAGIAPSSLPGPFYLMRLQPAIAAHAASCLGCCRTLLPVLLPTLRALPHATPQPHTRCPAATCCLAACVLHSHRALPCCCALPCCRPRCPLVHRIAVEPRRAAVPTTALRHATALSTAEPLPYFCAVLSLPVPSTHVMTLRPSSSPQLVVPMLPPSSSLPGAPDPESDLAHAASPTLVESSVVYRPDYFMSLVSESDRPPSVRGELALGCDVLKERLFELECLVALVPHLTAMLFAPEGDADALDIPTPCSYAEAITGQYSS